MELFQKLTVAMGYMMKFSGVVFLTVTWIQPGTTAALSLPNHRSTDVTGTACHQLYVEYPSLLALQNSTIYETERIG